MTAANFQKSLQALLRDEGGNDDDPDDHGGRTSRGVTQREYSAWLKEQHRVDQDVWTAPQADIIAIYHQEYWLPNCDALPMGIDYLYFNMAVNGGPYRSTVLLQRSIGVADDGRIGPITRAAVASFDAKTLVNNFTASSVKFYQGLHQPKYIKGWLSRCRRVQNIALQMIEGRYQ